MLLLIGAGSALAQTAVQSGTAEAPASEQTSAADQAKEAANPLANIWLLQMQQNNWWVTQPVGGTRVESNLQF
ncbi:MAG TPA: hypothetical protein VE178_02530, partial [Silvibacterium sp.]|nr:hypothetical protein [Silvibacterium sp.]